MWIEASGPGTALIVAVMALVTLATRWGGLLAMSRVPLGHRVRQFIAAMSGSVLVALLAPLAVEGDGGARAALATTAAVMLLSKRPLPSITAGVLAAAIYRQLL